MPVHSIFLAKLTAAERRDLEGKLSGMVFGAKQSRDFWIQVFKTGSASSGKRVLTEPIDINKMIRSGDDSPLARSDARTATS